jgi:hypothetical protein
MKWIFAILMFSVAVFAQDALPIVEPSFLEKALAVISSFAEKVPGGIPAAASAVIVVVWDIVRRIWPTLNPASFLGDAVKILNGVIALLSASVGLLGKLAVLLEGLAQNLKKPEEKK